MSIDATINNETRTANLLYLEHALDAEEAGREMEGRHMRLLYAIAELARIREYAAIERERSAT